MDKYVKQAADSGIYEVDNTVKGVHLLKFVNGNVDWFMRRVTYMEICTLMIWDAPKFECYRIVVDGNEYFVLAGATEQEYALAHHPVCDGIVFGDNANDYYVWKYDDTRTAKVMPELDARDIITSANVCGIADVHIESSTTGEQYGMMVRHIDQELYLILRTQEVNELIDVDIAVTSVFMWQ
jgi:hypothetical protein